MLKPLTLEQAEWVERTLANLSIEERVGHLLCPEDRNYSPDDWAAILRDVPLGCVFLANNPPERWRACVEAIQSNARTPILIASDLEHGAGCMIEGCTDFPWSMAAGAANSPELMTAMGRATAIEGRQHGVHWTFSPVVDLNVNFQNPVTNVRSLGDQPEPVARLATAWITGMQESGLLAATAKHFPGDGMDDRDQHLCTTVNSKPFGEWMQTYGQVWKAVISAGVMSIMCGHISLPDYEGLAGDPAAALPATLSPRLQIDLLRKELGFDGVIVSDAAPMIGIASRVRSDQAAIRNILAGSDVYLFAEPRRDFKRLMGAVQSGAISTERATQSARRVLEMKARLGLHHGVFGPAPTPGQREQFHRDAQAMADRSITLARANPVTPVKLAPGARILTVTIRHVGARQELSKELAVVDEELRRRGFQVDHLLNPDCERLITAAGDYDAVFVNLVHTPHALIGTIRLTGEVAMPFWRAFWVDHSNAVFTSFGSPYHLYELPHLPNMLLAYGPSEFSQRAAVKVWLGEQDAKGRCPVALA